MGPDRDKQSPFDAMRAAVPPLTRFGRNKRRQPARPRHFGGRYSGPPASPEPRSAVADDSAMRVRRAGE
jgi:hypothetical protein